MGRALTEAALAGVPIVAFDYDWQREVVVDWETGFLVPHKDWMRLSDKTEFILLHPDDGRRMGNAVRQKILEMMNPERLDRHEQNEYSKLFKRFPSKNLK
jgi:glycosyltransferase involved in cell wall biosynthesis